MTVQELASRSFDRNYRVVEGRLVGVYEGFPFSAIVKDSDSKFTITIDFALERQINTKTFRQIKKELPKKSQILNNVANSLTVIVQSSDSMTAHNLLNDTLKTVISNFTTAQNPIKTMEQCPICRKNECDSIALFNNKFRKTHRQCVLEKNTKEVELAEKNETSGNVLLGVIGAILGAIVGCLPNIITILFFNYHFGLLYIVIPLISYQGYKLFRGRRGYVASIVVSLCSIAAFMIMAPGMTFIVKIIRGYSANIIFEVVHYYTNTTITNMIVDNWFGALFLVIGIFSGFKTIGIGNEEIRKAATGNIESLTSLDGRYAPADYSEEYKPSTVELEY